GGLEYDFTVRAGADPSRIGLSFAGAQGLDISSQGDLLIHTAAGDLVQHAPVLNQDAGGQRQPVAGRFVLHSGVLAFDTCTYDHSQRLIMDPLVPGYPTYLGGSGDDYGTSIGVDGIGAAYVTGKTQSLNFPTTPGAFDTTYNGAAETYVVKLNSTGTALV